jgi:hypothetical protein
MGAEFQEADWGVGLDSQGLHDFCLLVLTALVGSRWGSWALLIVKGCHMHCSLLL